jgi:LmbE family N-acetylglucosaminyl deacetylase
MTVGALVISPHPDDAVLSLGASIGSHPNVRTHVWNVFSWQLYSLSGPASPDVVLAEECDAIGLIGADVTFAGLPEAGTRAPSARLSDLLGAERADLQTSPTSQLLSDVMAALRDVLSSQRPDVVFGPLGAGGHVDHVIAREALIAVTREVGSLPVALYEDLPYALNTSWREAALVSVAGAGFRLSPTFLSVPDEGRLKLQALGRYPSQLRPSQVQRVVDHGWSSENTKWGERIWWMTEAC